MKKLITLTFIYCAVASCAYANEQIDVSFSGMLGQSAKCNQSPWPFTDVQALTVKDSRIFIGSERYIYIASCDGGHYQKSATIKLPARVKARGVISDGESVYVVCHDNYLYKLEEGGLLNKLAFLGKDCRAVAVSKASTKSSPEDERFFLLFPGYIRTLTGNGTVIQKKLPLEVSDKIKTSFNCLKVNPDNGDFLIGTAYPDCSLYRFKKDGTSAAWLTFSPAGVTAIDFSGKTIEVLTDHGWGFQILPSGKKIKHTLEWRCYSRDFHKLPGGKMAVATSQGLLFFDEFMKPFNGRLGGLQGIITLAVSDEGVILAGISNGTRLIRLYADDMPNAPLLSNGNGHWRIGGKSGSAIDIKAGAKKFWVLDGQNKTLWSFDASRARYWGDKPWRRILPDKTFKQPCGLAVGDSFFVVLDGSKLLASKFSNPDFSTPVFSGLKRKLSPWKIDGNRNDQLIVASRKKVQAFQKGKGNNFEFLWEASCEFENIAGVAAADSFVVVVDDKARQLSVLDMKTGNKLVDYSGADSFLKSMTLGSLSLVNGWIYVVDKNSHSILRLKIKISL